MATKKYVSLDKLAKYDELIKQYLATKDTAVLDAAKAYSDSLKDNYDVAGSAATVKSELEAKDAELLALIQANQAAAKKAQDEVDALELLVGTLPEGTTATSVVDYVNVKTAGIATDAALGELQSQLSGAQQAIDAIEEDYLKAADKTELSDAITAEANRAKGIEGGLETRLKAVEDDYLKEEDKTALQGSIDTLTGKVNTLVGEDAGKSARTIANEELAKQLIADGAKESLDTLGEIAAWIQEHPDDAAAMNKAIEDLEAFVGALPEGVEATTIVAYVQEAVAAEKDRAELAESGLAQRIGDLESSVGEGGSVDEKIADAIADEVTARNAAIAEVQADADKGIADAAAAKTAADNAQAAAEAAQAKADANEGALAGKAAAADLTALAGRVTTAEGEIDTLQSEMDAVEAKAAANETAIGQHATAIAGKAAQADLEAEVERAQAAEKANADAIAAFVEASEEEVQALFNE